MNFDNVEAAFRVLGLEPGAPLEEVKAAYKFSLQAYHPDKFPPDSPAQKTATEKLITVKDANELICAFYLEHPTGQPPEGWRSTSAGSEQGSAAKSSANAEDSTDWKDWNKGQSSSAANDLNEWEKREQERQKVVRSGHGREQRQKLVTYGKVALVIMVLVLWSGKMQSNSLDRISRQNQAAGWKEKSEYFAQTARGYGMTSDQVKARAMDEADAMKKRWQEDDAQKWLGILLLSALTGGVIYGFRSKKVKEFLDNWVDGNPSADGASGK